MSVSEQEYQALLRRVAGKAKPLPALRPGPAAETWITLSYPPSSNHLYATVNGRRVLSREGRNYKNQVALQLRTVGVRPISGPVAFHMNAFCPDNRRRDLSNLFKIVEDSLTGIVWKDDSQVVEINAVKRVDDQNPRVEILVLELKER